MNDYDLAYKKVSEVPLETVADPDDELLIFKNGQVNRINSASVFGVQFFETTATGDDKGVICTEQFSVGTPTASREAVFGGGDSYPVIGAWHFNDANLTNQTITSATDITEIIQSDSGSTVGLFDGVTAGKCILVYSDSATYGGIKAKIDTGGVVEPANIEASYLSAENTWTTAPFMAADSDTLEPYANVLAARSDSSEQWRFGFNPLNLPVSWEKLTMTINSVEYTGYFARFCITSDITSDPLIEQIKLHTNRFEVNANGRSEYFGIARYPKTIPILKSGNVLSNPPNENIKIAAGITELRRDNEFSATAKDGLILRGVIPEGIDTSIPIQVIIDWYAKGTGSGDVELEFEVVGVGEDFVYDGSATATAALPDVVSIDDQKEVRQRTVFLIDNASALSGDTMYGHLFRDGTSGNTDDNYGGSIVITNYQVIGYFWKP